MTRVGYRCYDDRGATERQSSSKLHCDLSWVTRTVVVAQYNGWLGKRKWTDQQQSIAITGQKASEPGHR